ncbi:MAG: PAS domain S-box protein [Tildeniella nuda ZEHNDER 1965/U140]|jgi:PAS domain S-box-containing protein|nr:PAS domain S-box protein [Tildeniella nuda ZEHNDER 1965/U140]
MKPEHLERLRECCKSDVAFERMQQILLAAEAEQQQVELKTLCRSLLGDPVHSGSVGADRSHYFKSLEELMMERTADLLSTNSRLQQENIERRRAEKALQESEQRFRSLIENATDIIVVLDRKGTFRYCSPSAAKLLGYTIQDVVGYSTAEFVHPDDIPIIVTVLEQAIEQPKVSQPAIEYRVRNRDGSWLFFEAVATCLLDVPAINGVVINCHDITERKRAEEALLIANRQTVTLLESITEAFMSLDKQWRLTYVNQQAAQLCQRSREALLGQCLWDVFPDIVGSVFDREYHRAMEHQVPVTFEEFHPSLNAWFDVRLSPCADGMSVFFLDVTERKQAQAELLEMSTALGNAVEGIARLDINGHYIALNRAYAAALGYQQEEMIGMSWQQTVHPNDIAVVVTAYQQMMIEGKAEVESMSVRKDGSTFYSEKVMVAAYDWHDRLIGFHCFTKDITERKQAEAALLESQERLKLTLETTQMGIWDYEPHRNTVKWSDSCEQLYGFAPGTFDGTNEAFLECIHPDDRAAVLQHTIQQTQQATNYSKEFRIIQPDGSIRWISERSHTFHDEMGQPTRTLGISMDTTDRKRFEEALSQQAERERLMSAIAQRIRTSLDLEETLNTTVSEVQQFLKADRVVLFEVEQKNSGRITAESVDANWQSMLGLRVQDNWVQHTLEAQQQGEVVVWAKAQELDSDSALQRFLEAWQVKAVLAVPILHGNTIWGVLVAQQCSTERHWETYEIGLLEQLATQVAIAIQQSELYRQVQQLNTALEAQVHDRTAQLQQALRFEATLKRITDSVRDSLDEDRILHTAVQELASGLEIMGCDAALYDLERRTSTVCYEHIRSDLPAANGTTIKMDDLSDVYDWLLREQCFQFCRTHPSRPRLLGSQHAILACPMVDDQGVMGDLWLFRPFGDTFTSQEIRLVQQVANQCAIAIRQARLYQAAQAQVAALEELNQLKDDFLSTVSHELRTPMSNMKMAIHMLKTVSAPDRQARYLNILQSECSREIELINDLLDLQRLEASAYPVSLETVDLLACVTTMVEPFYSRTSDREQRLSVQLPTHLPAITTDRATLQRVLAELLNNACKYTSPGNAVTLAVNCDHSDTAYSDTALGDAAAHVIFTISNQAEIPITELPHIFEKFYRVPNADPWKQGGTGLGLALVQRLIMQLEGVILVESSNGWTHFSIQLPLLKCSLAETTLPTLSPQAC